MNGHSHGGKIPLVLGHDVALHIGGGVQIPRDDGGGKTQGGDLLQGEVKEPHVVRFEADLAPLLQDGEISFQKDVLKDSVNLLLDIIFNPYLENNKFKEEYVEAEKNNVKLLIESKIDTKDFYALNRCIEEMYKDKPYGLYKYGYILRFKGCVIRQYSRFDTNNQRFDHSK